MSETGIDELKDKIDTLPDYSEKDIITAIKEANTLEDLEYLIKYVIIKKTRKIL